MKASVVQSTRQIVADYLVSFENLLRGLDLEGVSRITERLADARDRGATIYVAGNGGSAAIASHWANDLGKMTKLSGRRPIRVMCLSDNIPWVTALANDEGYERVFAGQLENFAQIGDVLIVISSSGNSPNLLRAVELARQRGVFTIGVLGFDGGLLKHHTDDCLVLKTEKGAYALVEPAHEMICHIVTTCLTNDRASDNLEM